MARGSSALGGLRGVRHGGGGRRRAACGRRGAPVRRAGDVGLPGAVPLLHGGGTRRRRVVLLGAGGRRARRAAVLSGSGVASCGVTVNATRALELPGKCKGPDPTRQPVPRCGSSGMLLC